LKPYSRGNKAEQISLFEHALAPDPQSVEAQSRLAGSLVDREHDPIIGSATADLERAEGLVGRALAASPRSAYAHFVKGRVLHARGGYEEAVPEFETALALNRNMVGALHELGSCKLFTGSIDEVIPLVEQAIRLSPRDPDIARRYFQIGSVYLLQSRIDEAIIWLEKARNATRADPRIRAWLASAFGLKGETEHASAELAEARKLSGDGRYSSVTLLRAVRHWGVPKIRALFETSFVAGLRKAGVPEE
jgi:tetratricopeptide (TPR) repeat protein